MLRLLIAQVLYLILSSLDQLHLVLFQNGFLSAIPFALSYIFGVSAGYLADWMRENNILSTAEARKVFATGGECHH